MSLSLKEATKVIAEYMGYKLVKGGYYSTSKCGNPLRGVRWQYSNASSAKLFFRKGDEIIHESKVLYSQSLDSLVPVWEKMKLSNISIKLLENKIYLGSIGLKSEYVAGDIIQQAACLATAQAILDRKEGE